MMEIGVRLKEAREEKNISLDSLQETTKIQKRYLEAIERGDFHILPGKFYARAFIKEYANAVGLDPTELINAHSAEIPSSDTKEMTEYTQTRRSRHREKPTSSNSIFSLIPTIIVILLVISIFFVAWVLYKQTIAESPSEPIDDQDENPIIRDVEDEEDVTKEVEDDANEDDEEGTENEEAETTDDPEFSLVDTGTGNSPESTFDLNNISDDTELSIVITGETYLQLTNGSNEVLLDGMFNVGDSPELVSLAGEESLYFNIGYTPNLKIMVNETELEYPVEPQNSVHQKIRINLNQSE